MLGLTMQLVNNKKSNIAPLYYWLLFATFQAPVKIKNDHSPGSGLGAVHVLGILFLFIVKRLIGQ